MKVEQKIILIICLVLALAVSVWFNIKPSQNQYNSDLLEHEIKQLEWEKEGLRSEIKSRDLSIKTFAAKIDSLETLKPKIQWKYDTIYKKIDNANANAIANQFTSVFSNANVK